MSRSAPDPTAARGLASAQRREALMKGKALRENAGIASRQPRQKSWAQASLLRPCQIAGMTSLLQEAMQRPCPRFFLNLYECLEFAQMMGVTQRVRHPVHG